MKKLFAIALALVMVLSMVAVAAAETRTYVMVTVTDLEGNEVATEGLPVLVFGMDNETFECAFGTAEETKAGTFEIVANEDGIYALNVTVEDESMLMEYIEAEDIVTYVDQENGLVFIMVPYEAAE